jgi:hypothetical protein
MNENNAKSGIGILPMHRATPSESGLTSIALPRRPKMHRQDADATTRP